MNVNVKERDNAIFADYLASVEGKTKGQVIKEKPIEALSKKYGLSYSWTQRIVADQRLKHGYIPKHNKRISTETVNNIISDYKAGVSIDIIRKKYMINPSVIYRILKEHDVPVRALKDKKLADAIFADYIVAVNGNSHSDLIKNRVLVNISNKYDIPKTTIKSIVYRKKKKAGMVITDMSDKERRDRDLLIIKWYRDGHRLTDISYKFNLTVAMIYRILSKYGVERNRRRA